MQSVSSRTIGPARVVPPLHERELHVWAVRLDDDAESCRGLATRLSADELERAGRFRLARDRHRFIVGRVGLRTLLGCYIGETPSAIRFRYGSHGRPELSEPSAVLRFNVAHSGDLATYAFGRFDSVGIDVEYISSVGEIAPLARRFFTTREAGEVISAPEADKLHAFYRCWTRKEAYLKALGRGLAEPLDAFEVSVALHEAARLRHVAGDAREAEQWSMFAFEPAAGAVAAVAVRCRTVTLTFQALLSAADLRTIEAADQRRAVTHG
jgi:4'-phosphopantetheinyl transferase